jgi:hypothetical protein
VVEFFIGCGGGGAVLIKKGDLLDGQGLETPAEEKELAGDAADEEEGFEPAPLAEETSEAEIGRKEGGDVPGEGEDAAGGRGGVGGRGLGDDAAFTCLRGRG